MGQALYRKYRSKKLSEIIGQEHITTTLERALKQGAISHAYFFTGPRGVGKTSVARILAHEVNGLPYDDDSMHLDIIEIDAASNRRIDEIRDLREHVHSAPTSGKYKVYIIDEVHMLTKEAFNALLKTLEEPPQHVIFILATTEAHKVPETIVSRTQRFTFRAVEPQQAVDHLRFIASTEGVEVEDLALALIADHGQGSFRDSISLLDQVSGGRKKVTLRQVEDTLGIAPDSAIQALLSALELGSASTLLDTLEDMRQNGYHTSQLAKQLASKLRQMLFMDESFLSRSQITDILKKLIDVPASHDPETLLELILIGVLPEKPSTTRPKQAKEPVQAAKQQKEPPVVDIQEITEETIEEIVQPEAEITVELTKAEVELDEQSWQAALSILKKSHNTLYGVARMASPTFSDDTVTLTFAFAFHQKRLDDTKHKKILADILSEVIGSKIDLVCIVEQTHKPKKSSKPAKNNDLENISNIFGEAEVVD